MINDDKMGVLVGWGGLIHWTTGTLRSDYDWLRVPSTRFLSLDDDIGKSDGSEKI